MAFTLPNFMLLCDVYDPADPLYPGTATLLNVPCQLYKNARALISENLDDIRMPIEPINTSLPYLRAGNAGFLVWNLSHTAGYYFQSSYFHQVHAGFANSYFIWTCFATDNGFVNPVQSVFNFNG